MQLVSSSSDREMDSQLHETPSSQLSAMEAGCHNSGDDEDIATSSQVGGGRHRRSRSATPSVTPTKLRPHVTPTANATSSMRKAALRRAKQVIHPAVSAVNFNPISEDDQSTSSAQNPQHATTPDPHPPIPAPPSTDDQVPAMCLIPPTPDNSQAKEISSSVLDILGFNESQPVLPPAPTPSPVPSQPPSNSFPTPLPSSALAQRVTAPSQPPPALPSSPPSIPAQLTAGGQPSSLPAAIPSDENHSADEDEDWPSPSRGGRPTTKTLEQLELAYKKIDTLLSEISDATGYSTANILDLYDGHASMTGPRNTSFWNLYQKYLRANIAQEMACIGSSIQERAKVSQKMVGEAWEKFRATYPTKYKDILLTWNKYEVLNSSQQTVATRTRDFNKSSKKMVEMFDEVSIKHGFEIVFAMVGGVPGQDQGLSRVHTTPGAAGFFQECLRTSDNALISHLTAYTYMASSRKLTAETWVDSDDKNIEAIQGPRTPTNDPMETNAHGKELSKSSKTTLTDEIKQKFNVLGAQCNIPAMQSSQLLWKLLPSVVVSSGYTIVNYPEDVPWPNDAGGKKGIACLNTKQLECLLEALDHPDHPLHFERTRSQKAIIEGRAPAIIGTPPPSTSKFLWGRRKFLSVGGHSAKEDRDGPPRQLPSRAKTTVKSKGKMKATVKTVTAPSTSKEVISIRDSDSESLTPSPPPRKLKPRTRATTIVKNKGKRSSNAMLDDLQSEGEDDDDVPLSVPVKKGSQTKDIVQGSTDKSPSLANSSRESSIFMPPSKKRRVEEENLINELFPENSSPERSTSSTPPQPPPPSQPRVLEIEHSPAALDDAPAAPDDVPAALDDTLAAPAALDGTSTAREDVPLANRLSIIPPPTYPAGSQSLSHAMESSSLLQPFDSRLPECPPEPVHQPMHVDRQHVADSDHHLSLSSHPQPLASHHPLPAAGPAASHENAPGLPTPPQHPLQHSMGALPQQQNHNYQDTRVETPSSVVVSPTQAHPSIQPASVVHGHQAPVHLGPSHPSRADHLSPGLAHSNIPPASSVQGHHAPAYLGTSIPGHPPDRIFHPPGAPITQYGGGMPPHSHAIGGSWQQSPAYPPQRGGYHVPYSDMYRGYGMPSQHGPGYPYDGSMHPTGYNIPPQLIHQQSGIHQQPQPGISQQPQPQQPIHPQPQPGIPQQHYWMGHATSHPPSHDQYQAAAFYVQPQAHSQHHQLSEAILSDQVGDGEGLKGMQRDKNA